MSPGATPGHGVKAAERGGGGGVKEGMKREGRRDGGSNRGADSQQMSHCQ